jgi:3-deoxy-D-manno-octulosonic-acid transferase
VGFSTGKSLKDHIILAATRMWWLYQALVLLALVGAGPFLLARRGRHYLAALPQRLGRPAPAPGAEVVGGGRGGLWIHAVSVGEVAVAATLARALPTELPLVVTTVTPTGQERARALFAGRAAVAYHPFELGFALARCLDRYAPRALVLSEGDLWPLALAAVRRRGLPVAVVNGRVSDRTFPRLSRLRRWVRPLLLDRVDRFGVQTAIDRERLLALGVPDERLTVTGNLKFEATAPPERPELGRRLRELAAGRPVLVAGSTMAGEEAAVLDAFAAAGGGERAMLVLAPRHPERFGAVAELAAGRFARTIRRSAPPGSGERPEVVLLDTLGELAALYREARGAFVGGTLVPTGGHNPIEPARFGVPVAVGPSMENFREIAEAFDAAGAWRRIEGTAALAAVFREWLDDPDAAAALGRRGADLVAAHGGALERTRALLEPVLAAARGGA